MNDHPVKWGGHALHSGKALELNFSPFELKLGLVSLNTLLSAMSTPPTCTAQNHHAELAETTEIELTTPQIASTQVQRIGKNPRLTAFCYGLILGENAMYM